MECLKKQIQAYKPRAQREVADRALILHAMEVFPDTLTRENKFCHFTASSWVVNPERTKALLIFHNIQQKWMWTGGHADGKSDLAKVALCETQEETSLRGIRLLSDEIFSLEVLEVAAHMRRGKFVNAHLHLNCGFLLEADEQETFKIKDDENSGIRWVDFEEIIAGSKSGAMSSHYAGLIERLKRF